MSVERAGQLLRELSGSPTACRLEVSTVLATVVESAAPELLAPDGTIDAQDLRRIVQATAGSSR
jgi:hypothetical protein